MKRKVLIGAGVAALALGAAVTYSRFTGEIEVDVFEAKRGRIEEYVTSVSAGTVKSRHESTLSAEVGGRAIRVVADEGSRVRKGDLLALLSDPELTRQVDAATRWALHALATTIPTAARTAPIASGMMKAISTK